MLFKTANKKIIDNIYEEFCSSDMTKDEFEDMLKLPKRPKDFILINTRAPIEEKYRLNYDNFLIL